MLNRRREEAAALPSSSIQHSLFSIQHFLPLPPWLIRAECTALSGATIREALMLTPSQVIPFLEHEDFTVRRLAVDYLRDAHDPAPATADDLWRAYERFPQRDQFGLSSGFLYALPFLPATDSSTARLLDALRAGSDKDDEDRHQMLNALADLDFPMLAQNREAIFQLPGLPPRIEERLRARLALAEEAPEPLWERLAEFAKAVEN